MNDILGWTIVEILGSNQKNTDGSYSRGIQCFLRGIPSFSSKEEAEVYLSKMETTGRRLEVISLKPLRRSLEYQGIARRSILE